MTSLFEYAEQVDIIDCYTKNHENEELTIDSLEFLNIVYNHKNPLSHKEIAKLSHTTYGIYKSEDAVKMCFSRLKEKIMNAIKNDPRWGITPNDINIKNIRRKLDAYIINPQNSELLGLALKNIEKKVDYIEEVKSKNSNSITESDRKDLKRIQNKIGMILEKK